MPIIVAMLHTNLPEGVEIAFMGRGKILIIIIITHIKWGFMEISFYRTVLHRDSGWTAILVFAYLFLIFLSGLSTKS